MTLDGSLQRSVTCRYHSMPSPTLSLMHSTCGSRYNERGEEPPSRFWLCRCHASPLALERGPAPSFLSSSPPLLPPPLLFYIPSTSFFFPSRTVVNGSSRADFGGDAPLRQNPKGDGGDSAGRLQHVALCHFFIHPRFCGRLA